MKHLVKGILGLLFACIILMAFSFPQDQKKGAPWEIPGKYQKMENPYKDDASLAKVGKMLFSKHCKSCHGSKGLGDGTKAAQLETFPGDFSSDAFKKNSDGELFYKSFVGRDDMPNFEKKIPDDEDQWAIVNFMRTF